MKKHVNALLAEAKIIKNIQKTYPDSYIVVKGGSMLRGVYDRHCTAIIRFKDEIAEDRGPFKAFASDADTVTVHSFADATKFAKLAGGDAKPFHVNSEMFKEYVKALTAAAKLADYKFGYGE